MIISIVSGKGGVGKTTITANLGMALAEMNKDVLIIDVDIEMPNLSLVLGIEERGPTLYDVLRGEAELQDAIVGLDLGKKYREKGTVLVLPASLALEKLKYVEPDRLKEIFTAIPDFADFVLVDSAPGLGKSTLASICYSDRVILVATPEIPTISDNLRTIKVARKIGAELGGFILNHYSKETAVVTAKEMETLLNLPCLGVIPEDRRIRACTASGKLFFLRYPKIDASFTLRKVACILTGESSEKYEKRSPIERLLSLFRR